MDRVSETLASLEMALHQRDREIDLLRLDLDRCSRQWKEAEARAAMLQVTLDRHMAYCSRDDGAIQRLIGELAESTARRKEQAAVIKRRDQQIIMLKKEMRSLQRLNVIGSAFSRFKQAFSRGQA